MAVSAPRCLAVLALLCISQVSAFSRSSSSTAGIPPTRYGTHQGLGRSVPPRMIRKTAPSAVWPHNIIHEHSAAIISNSPAKKLLKRKLALKLVSRAALALCTLTLVSSAPAHAAAATTTGEHLHTGQKIANFFRSFGIPDLAVLTIISALPVVELRGAVPVGIWMGIPITTVLPVCIIGNMLPIVPLLFLLRNDKLKKLMKPILNRAEKKTRELGIGSPEKQWASLAAFVGIPLPGTGAWTGAMGAFLLDMPVVSALTSIFAGVVSAGVIMTALTLAGKKGGVAALCVLFLLTGIEFFKGDKEADEESTEPATE